MADEVTRSTADDITYAAVIIENYAIDIARANAIMRNLWTPLSLVGKPSMAMDVPAWPSLTATSKSEAAAMSNTALATTKKTITASVGASMKLVLSDELLSSQTLAGDLAPYGRQIGLAIADKMDADCMLGSSMSQTAGTSGANLQMSDIEDARYLLAAGNAPGQPFLVLHPVQVRDLRKTVTASGASLWSDINATAPLMTQAQLKGLIGGYMGIPVYESTNVPASSSDKAGFMAVPDYAGFVIKWETRIEPWRVPSAASWELNGTAAYGAGELVDAYGIKIVTIGS